MQHSLPQAGSPGAHVPTPEVQRYLDLSGELIVQLDPNQRVTLVNRSLLKALGYAAAEVLGRDWFELCVPEEDRFEGLSSFHAIMKAKASGTGRAENRILTKSAEVRRVSWRFSVLAEEPGRPVGLLASGEDVTNQRRAEHELARATRELQAYQQALDSSSIVAITDPRGRILHVNDRLCEVSQYSREELLGQDHRLLNSGHHPKSFFQSLWSTIKGGRIWRGDIRNRAKDGSVYWVSTTIVPFLDESEKPLQYVAIRNEITERKVAEAALERTVRELSSARQHEAERGEALQIANTELTRAHAQIREEQAKLIQAEKLSSIGLLAAGVAHEINNPLSGVMACMKALQEGTLTADRQHEYFSTAREGLSRIEQTVRGLLEFAAQRSPAPSEVQALALVDACLRLTAPLARAKSLQVVCDIPETVHLFVDRPQLMQAVMNVLLNALYASPPQEVVRVKAVHREDLIGLQIRDRGAGMPDEIINRACDPFFSTKPEGEGTGLGLSVTMSIVKAHGGDIQFDSVPNEGTAVTLWLPKEGAPHRGLA